MTKQELEHSWSEMAARTFNIDCSFNCSTYPHFNANHYNDLKNKYIYNCCWETLLKMKFPFEYIVPNLHSVFLNSEIRNNRKTVKGVDFVFNICILNYSRVDIHDFLNLTQFFSDIFIGILSRNFKIPIDSKSSVIHFDVSTSHFLYKELNNNQII